jgi:ATPase subunit of ABC transporter with duplicated ATPase domains
VPLLDFSMLVLKNIHKRFGIQRVLEGVSFSVGEGQKTAIVGGNSTGKSTLLRIIAGDETFERGERILPNRILIGYLPQETPVFEEETIEEYLFRQSGIKEHQDIIEVTREYLTDEHQLARFEAATLAYEKLGGAFFLKKAHKHLRGLLMHTLPLNTPAQILSGGQKRKLALAGVLLRGVDLLVLDEPTNNLDLPALLYLEKFLSQSKATVVMASHDRVFLDKIVQKIFEIDWYTRQVSQFAGGYTDYAEQKQHKLRRADELWRAETVERGRLESSEMEKRNWVDKLDHVKKRDNNKLVSNYKIERAAKKFHAAATSIVTRAERMHKHEEPILRKPPEILLKVPSKEKGSIVFKGATLGYPSGFQLAGCSMTIPFGMKLALLGDNGVGKTTFLKTLIGEQALLAGKLTVGAGVTFGYFMQEHDLLDQEQTVHEYLKRNEALVFNKDEILFEIGRFGLPPDTIDDKIKYLSPGGRVRMILARLVLSGANTLILDEPTNHLDLDAIEALEDALEGFPGTLIVVSHDRMFLDHLGITDWYEIAKGTLRKK